MTNRRATQWFVFAIALLATTGQASAGEPDGKARSEAKELFSRGLHMFENGDHAGALAEFERAHELAPSRLLLYHIALVYMSMGKPVEAVESFDEVLSDPGPLKPEYIARAREAKEEQQGHIGQLDVKVNVPAAIVIDGSKAGEAPLQAPLPVAAGEHIVAVAAPGHVPARQSITVAGQGRADLVFELQPTEAKLAHVTIHSPLPGAEVRLDDELLGKTPFADPVSVLPGKRVFEIQRPGYMSGHRQVNLADGAYATVAFDPDEDDSAGAGRGRLQVMAGGGNIELTIDGRPRGVYRRPIDLPAGPHAVKLERDGFEPLERLVEVPTGGEAEVKVSLRRSAKTRAAQVSHAHSYRNWAIAALASGAVVAGGSLGLTLWSNGKLSSREDKLDQLKSEATGGGSCDPSSPAYNEVVGKNCRRTLADAQDEVNKYRNMRLGGIIGTVGGVALIGVGVTLLLITPDSGRDDRAEPLAGTLVPVLSAGPDGASLALRGQF
jgi:hypothetical protein